MSLDLTSHFSRFFGASPDRIHLAAHSHHYWPDVTFEAQAQAALDAARYADDKWGKAVGPVMERVRAGIAARLALPDSATIAIAPNTHDFVRRLLSCLPKDRPPRVLTSDAEFHSFTRQIARLGEDGLVKVERVPAEPFDSFAERFSERAAAGGHDLLFVSQVFFNSGAIGPDLAGLVAAVRDHESFLVIDGYHGFMALPTDLSEIAGRAFYIAGGYKYAMAGEGCCFMHCPPGWGRRPRDTGWFAAFGALADAQQGVPYSTDGYRFMGATFDPSGLYRLGAVFDWMDGLGLTVADIHAHVLGLQQRFLGAVEAGAISALAAARLVTPAGEGIDRGHFLTFETPEADAMQRRLAERYIVTDVRADRIRFGFACYHTEALVDRAVTAIADALAQAPPRRARPARPTEAIRDDDIWENMISRNSHVTPVLEAMQPPAAYRDSEGPAAQDWRDVDFHLDIGLDEAVARDTWPLPFPVNRENYYHGQDFGYWASGLLDLGRMLACCREAGLTVERYLDFGCSSGRVLRHMAAQFPEVVSHGCDTDRTSVEWVLRFLSPTITAFQNHAIPTLPLRDGSIDLISAFSVFTHIECFETTWLMELARILRPGGIAYLTVHTDRTWRELDDSIVLLDLLKTHPDFAALDRAGPMPRDPLVFRFDARSSYSSHVLVSADRIRSVWGRAFEVLAILPKHSFDQDVAVLRKR